MNVIESLMTIFMGVTQPLACAPMADVYQQILLDNYGEQVIYTKEGSNSALEFFYDREDGSYTIVIAGDTIVCIMAAGFLGEDV